MLLNLQLAGLSIIQSVVPSQQVTVSIYAGQVNINGYLEASYVSKNYSAVVEPELDQQLLHLVSFDVTKIYKRFYIQAVLTGLNRPMETGGDTITTLSDGVKYRIVKMLEQYHTGYTCVIGVAL